jgi:hypothetical protein
MPCEGAFASICTDRRGFLNFHLPRRLRVKAAEERLAAAKAAREAMDEPQREWSICTTYDGPEWLVRNSGGAPPGPDTGLIADVIRRQYEGRRQADG